MKVKFKRLYPHARIPTFGNGDASNAGIDFYARLESEDAEIAIRPGESIAIGLGVAWEPEMVTFEEPYGSDTVKVHAILGFKAAMIIKGRSGLAIRNNIEASNAGLIDAGYRGEIVAKIMNNGLYTTCIKNGDRIAQGVIVALPVVEIVEAAELTPSPRGENGFGSTGR